MTDQVDQKHVLPWINTGRPRYIRETGTPKICFLNTEIVVRI